MSLDRREKEKRLQAEAGLVGRLGSRKLQSFLFGVLCSLLIIKSVAHLLQRMKALWVEGWMKIV